MDAVAPSVFNGRLQFPWYSGRGLFLDPPTLAMQRGQWRLSLPAWLSGCGGGGGGENGHSNAWPSVGAAFDSNRFESPLAARYEAAIGAAMSAHEASFEGKQQLGACILEPLLQGAGGMVCIDPAFQHALAKVSNLEYIILAKVAPLIRFACPAMHSSRMCCSVALLPADTRLVTFLRALSGNL